MLIQKQCDLTIKSVNSEANLPELKSKLFDFL